MKYLIAILLIASPLTDLDEIAKVNSLKKKAKEAYVKGDYTEAVEHYKYLLDSMQVEDPNITLNLANAYYQLKDSAGAANNYNALLNSNDRIVKSVAHQQLGVMADRAKQFELALDHFKNAIKADPTNDEARYNYEMLKKMLDEQKKKQDEQKDQQKQNKDDQNKDDQKQQDQKNKDQQKQDQEKQQQEQKDKEGEQKENEQKEQQNKEDQQKDAQEQKDKQGKEGEEKKQEQPKPEEGEESEEEKAKQDQMQSLSEKLKEMKISEEKAKMILEALKNNEIQYIQQNKRKATKRKDPGKPDW